MDIAYRVQKLRSEFPSMFRPINESEVSCMAMGRPDFQRGHCGNVA